MRSRAGRFYSHSTAQAAWLWAIAVGLRLLGNDQRLFTGVGVQSVGRVVRVVGQGAAVPHRGLSYIQNLIAHCLLRTNGTQREAVAAKRERRESARERRESREVKS